MKQIFILMLPILATTSSFGQSKFDSMEVKPIHQLRIYEVPLENKQAFHNRFRDHAQRIMKKYGFKIVAMWESEFDKKTEFIYLLEWKDEATMKSSWSNFMSDKEWKEIKEETKKVHGIFVNNIEERTLVLTDYSPTKILTIEN